MARSPRTSRRRGTQGPAPSTPQPIFGGGVSNIIPGEVIVQLHEDVATQITASIPRGPMRGRGVVGASSFGIDSLDSVIAGLKVTEITRLHPPAPVVSAAATLASEMASTFRISFTSDTSVERAVEQLASVDGVVYAEPNRWRETCVVPNDPSFPAQWGLTKINCPAAWDRTTGSPNVVVAVIDTGVDLNHPELAPLLVPAWDMVDLGPNPTPPPGFHFEGDFQARDNNPQDEVGHGTHVTGTIACLTNNAAGVAGVTWSCRIMPVRVLARIVSNVNPQDVRGTGSAADIAAGIRWAVDHGARVLNLSLGGPVDTQVERDAIAYAIAHNAVVCAAMGNAFQQGNPTSYPAAYPDVVAVAAIDQADHRAAFSQTGPHIDISAPGVAVLSTVWDNGFTMMSGTSMASPHVAGVAALVLSCNSNLTGPQVADILRQTARPLRDNPGDPVPNDSYGFGCVNAQAAVNRACPQPPVSRPIIRCPSNPVVCLSRPLDCPISRSITACPSSPVVCVSHPITACGTVSTVIRCPQPSNPLITCPQPSVVIRCPSGPVCGGPGPIEQSGMPDAGMGMNWRGAYDPYGSGGEEWEAYDPYAPDYGSGQGD